LTECEPNKKSLSVKSVLQIFFLYFSPLTVCQGRLTPTEWSDLVCALNDGACQGLINQPKPKYVGGDYTPVLRKHGLDTTLANLRPQWMERGIDLSIFGAAPVVLYVKIVPVGSSPVSDGGGAQGSTYSTTTEGQPNTGPQFCGACGSAGQAGRRFCADCGAAI